MLLVGADGGHELMCAKGGDVGSACLCSWAAWLPLGEAQVQRSLSEGVAQVVCPGLPPRNRGLKLAHDGWGGHVLR